VLRFLQTYASVSPDIASRSARGKAGSPAGFQGHGFWYRSVEAVVAKFEEEFDHAEGLARTARASRSVRGVVGLPFPGSRRAPQLRCCCFPYG
jgi:hypothetical protein